MFVMEEVILILVVIQIQIQIQGFCFKDFLTFADWAVFHIFAKNLISIDFRKIFRKFLPWHKGKVIQDWL